MYHLVIVVISIVLTASLSAASIVYSPLATLERKRAVDVADKGFEQLHRAVIGYIDNNREEELLYPIAPRGGSLLGQSDGVTPAYGFAPPNPRGFEWDVLGGTHDGEDAIGICLKANGAKDAGAVLNILASRMSSEARARGVNCNASGYSSTGTALTLWVRLSHFDPLLLNPVVDLTGGEGQIPEP